MEKVRLLQFVESDSILLEFHEKEDAILALYSPDELPQTIHGKFLRAHKHVKKVVTCAKNNCPEPSKKELIKRSEQSIRILGEAMEQFFENCVKELHKNSSYLENK